MKAEAERKLEEYRQRFRRAPVGEWTTARGTFDSLSGERLVFAQDGTGTLGRDGAPSDATKTAFEWREKAPLVIEMRYAADADEDEEEWDAVAYDFKLIEHDAGTEVVIYEVGQEGFWDVLAPLRLVE
jgi:transglutaminase-like putative cysteine protease